MGFDIDKSSPISQGLGTVGKEIQLLNLSTVKFGSRQDKHYRYL